MERNGAKAEKFRKRGKMAKKLKKTLNFSNPHQAWKIFARGLVSVLLCLLFFRKRDII